MVDSDLTPIQFFFGWCNQKNCSPEVLAKAGKSRVTWRISHALPCRITNALCYVYVTGCNVTIDIECHRQWCDLYLKDIFEAGYKKDRRKARALSTSCSREERDQCIIHEEGILHTQHTLEEKAARNSGTCNLNLQNIKLQCCQEIFTPFFVSPRAKPS